MANTRSELVQQLLAQSMARPAPRRIEGAGALYSGLAKMADAYHLQQIQQGEEGKEKASAQAVVDQLAPASQPSDMTLQSPQGGGFTQTFPGVGETPPESALRNQLVAMMGDQKGRANIEALGGAKLMESLITIPAEERKIKEARRAQDQTIQAALDLEDVRQGGKKQFDSQDFTNVKTGATLRGGTRVKDGAAFKLNKDGTPNTNQPLGEDWVQTSFDVTVDDPSNLAQDATSLRKLNKELSGIGTAVHMGRRIKVQLRKGATVGIAGGTTQAAQGFGEQLEQFMRVGDLLSGDDPARAAAIKAGQAAMSGENFERIFAGTELETQARKNAGLAFNLVTLAYLQAKVLDEEGRISDQDYLVQKMEAFAAQFQSVAQIEAAVDEMLHFAVTKADRSYRAVHNKPLPSNFLGPGTDEYFQPPSFGGGAAGKSNGSPDTLEGVTAEIAELEARRKQLTEGISP